jgi:hypothetical protein
MSQGPGHEHCGGERLVGDRFAVGEVARAVSQALERGDERRRSINRGSDLAVGQITRLSMVSGFWRGDRGFRGCVGRVAEVESEKVEDGSSFRPDAAWSGLGKGRSRGRSRGNDPGPI